MNFYDWNFLILFKHCINGSDRNLSCRCHYNKYKTPVHPHNRKRNVPAIAQPHTHTSNFGITGRHSYQLRNTDDLNSGHLRLKSDSVTDLLTDLRSTVSCFPSHFLVSNFPIFYRAMNKLHDWSVICSFTHLFIHLCFPPWKHSTMKEMCVSCSCAGHAVRGFNLSNPNVNPIVGEKCTHALSSEESSLV